MEHLQNISVVWSLIHAIFLFFVLFEPRYSHKKTIFISSITLIPLAIINLLLFFWLGFDRYGTLMLLSLSLPSCLILLILSKYRDGRFFFTFCMVDTIVLEILYVTNILDYYLTPDSHLAMFLLRLVAYPFLEIWVYKKVHPIYKEVQKCVPKGWVSYAIIGLLFYLAINLLMTHPNPITDRPDDLPALCILFFLMPVIYVDIISTLERQLTMHHKEDMEAILQLQVSNMTLRMEELTAADQKFRVERHNFRHKMKTIASLLEAEQYEECRLLLSEYNDAFERTKIKRYCQHSILDAVLSSYIQKAENSGIAVSYGLAFPDTIPVSENELATAIANALENAINACEKLPREKRRIDIKVLERPQMIIKIANSYEGDIEFDDDGIPVNAQEDHGFGTRFIAALCEKHDGFYQFQADGETFTLFLNF